MEGGAGFCRFVPGFVYAPLALLPVNQVFALCRVVSWARHFGGSAADYVRNHLKQGDPIKADYDIVGQDSSKGYSASDFKMMIGGILFSLKTESPDHFPGMHPLLEDTVPEQPSDRKKAYWITHERNGNSDGMILKELQQFMVQLGGL